MNGKETIKHNTQYVQRQLLLRLHVVPNDKLIYSPKFSVEGIWAYGNPIVSIRYIVYRGQVISTQIP